MDQAARKIAMGRLEPLVGEWRVEASFPGAGPIAVTGRMVVEWMLGGHFLVQRSEVAHPDAPDAHSIIALDPGGEAYVQHYFDSRGVVRIYAMTFADGVWTLLRESPDFSPLDFRQRFTGKFSGDGNTIEGAWETPQDGSTWELNFRLTYTKVR